MAKCVQIFDHKDFQIKALAENLIRASRLELLGAPPRILKKEYVHINKRIASFDTVNDAEKLLNAIEEVLLRNISSSLSSTSCLNCTVFLDCPKVTEEVPVNANKLPQRPYPYDIDALNLCDGYHPDWDKFDEAAKLYPEIIFRLESSIGIMFDRKRVALKLLDVMGKWATSVSR